MARILDRRVYAPTTFAWTLAAPEIARAARPGQFVMVRIREDGERIPLTLADFDPQEGTITLVIQAVGASTRQMLDALHTGDDVLDVAGPLGAPTELPRQGRVVLVGGGLGVAPIYPQARAVHGSGAHVTAILGFRSSDLVFWEDRFARVAHRVVICTEDGTLGRRGRVTDALADELESADHVIAVGPLAMMRAVAEVTRPRGVPTTVSLNAIMVDGTGMCGSCRVTVGGQVRFACVDGPDFDAHAVDFAELELRQRRFVAHEATARAQLEHVCHLEEELVGRGRRNYKRIPDVHPTATPMPERPAAVRARTFDEVNLGYDLASALFEAERCIQCKRPTCVEGCPVHIDIPGFIRKLMLRDLDGAAAVIRESNLFPSICGRVCPQESQCEAQCILTKKIEPVAIGRLERFVGDHATVAAPERAEARGRVVVVGSGPAGLACAGDLARAGVEVVVMEALHVLGGVLRYGIPAFRLPRDVLDRELDQLRALGVRFETNRIVGRTFTVADLLRDADAVFLGVGAGAPTMLGIPGESAGRCYSANELLTRVNLMGGERFPYQATPVALGRKVVVIGAGNTAMDCLRVARRLGADEVTCVYRRTEAEAPARREELRHAQEEGIRFAWLRSPVEIRTDGEGSVVGLRVEVMVPGEPDAKGRRKPVATGVYEEIDCDTVVTALGTRSNPILAQTTPGLALHDGGYFVADPVTQATSLPGVFAGGDIVTGGATVILALGAGRRAAQGILAWLQDRSWPPVVQAPVVPEALPVGPPSCARCHRPVEPGEEYVCCADATLQWSCQRCQKRCEGYALPFGACPACGGKLRLVEPEDADRAAVRAAMEVELGGQAFYADGAARAADPEVKDLFSRLAAMEHAHGVTLGRRYHLPPAAPVDPSTLPIYLGVVPPLDDAVGLLRLAVELERRAYVFFQGRVAEVAEGSPAWKLYRELAAEEEEHVAMLEHELARRVEGLAGVL